ncbi:MAG: hypothetical protein AB7C97_13700, partial [Oscillospiraceae bacterium]
MKKIITLTLTFIMLLTFPVYVHAGTIGQVLYTDIGTKIDEQPIASYNISGCTYVIAEDLRGYGFDVVWEADERTLAITRDTEAKKSLMDMDKINIKKSDIAVGRRAYDVYATDIKTYVGGEEVRAYNVGGKTLVRITELAKYGYLLYDDGARMVTLDMLKYDADEAYGRSSKTELPLPCDKEEGTITYSGDVAGGLPNGPGRITEHYEYTNGLQSVEDYSYTGSFAYGKYDGVICYEGFRHPLNGSDTRDSSYLSYYTYKDGALDGYSMVSELIKYCTRNEYIYANGQVTWERICVIDPAYVYGYYVADEGFVDVFGEIIDYAKIDTVPKIISVAAEGSASFAIDEDHNLYYFGNTDIEGLPRKSVPIKIDTDI